MSISLCKGSCCHDRIATIVNGLRCAPLFRWIFRGGAAFVAAMPRALRNGSLFVARSRLPGPSPSDIGTG
eukprot:6970817-Pyramimonas_sp.AAC.1